MTAAEFLAVVDAEARRDFLAARKVWIVSRILARLRGMVKS